MLALLIGLGVLLVAVGLLVLLRFPDRPGGKVRLLGLEVSSISAGLPLVALGLLAVMFAVLQQPDPSSTADEGSGGGGGGSVAGPPPANAPACLTGFFEDQPGVVEGRRRALAAEHEGVDVLGPGEPKREEFGLVLIDRGDIVGATKMSYDVDAEQFRVDGMVDAICQPVTWTASQVPGPDPSIVSNFDQLNMNLSGVGYLIEFNAGTEVEMELHRFQR